MENDQLNNLFELDINEEGRSNLSSIAQWAYINALVGFVALAVTLISTVMTISKFGAYVPGTIYSSLVISAIISLLLNITLITAANHLKKGISLSDQGHFNMGMMKLASYFKILGILMIILLVLVVLVMLLVLMAGASGGFK